MVRAPFSHHVEGVERELRAHGLQAMLEARERDTHRGLVFGRIVLPYPDAFLDMSEVIDMTLGVDPRAKYTYHLIQADRRLWGYDRDPKKPAYLRDHCHRMGSNRREPATITFGGALRAMWVTLSGVVPPVGQGPLPG